MSRSLLTVTFHPASAPAPAPASAAHPTRSAPVHCTVIRTPWDGETAPVAAYGLCCAWQDGRERRYPVLSADAEPVRRLAERLEGEALNEAGLDAVLEDFADELSWPRAPFG